jgi:hypothetical protein
MNTTAHTIRTASGNVTLGAAYDERILAVRATVAYVATPEDRTAVIERLRVLGVVAPNSYVRVWQGGASPG